MNILINIFIKSLIKALVNLLVNLPIDLNTKTPETVLMRRKKDLLYSRILSLVTSSNEPFETKEIEEALPKFTRIMILYRLNMLRGESRINGKQIGSGKGAWVWWKKSG